MHQVRRAALALAIVAALSVPACSSGDDAGSESSSASPTPYPSDAVVIEPLDKIPGAERIDVDGVGIDVMPGYVSQPARNQPEQTTIRINKEGEDTSVLLLLVTRYDRTVTDDDLDLGLYVFKQTARGLRGITDVVDIRVVWDAVVHPLGVEGIEHLTAEDSYDLRAISGRETDGDRTVAVQIWVEPGTDIDTCDAWQMVRTIQFDSAS